MQFLTFAFLLAKPWQERCSDELNSIIDRLRDPQITKSLKELTFGIQVYGYDPDWEQGLATMSGFTGWEDLDLLLCSVTTLRRVVIHVEFPPQTVDPTDLQLAMQGRLHNMGERGILSVVLGKIDDLEKDLWLMRSWL